MASALLGSLFSIFFLVAGLCNATDDYNILDYAIARRHDQWMVEYGRVYRDEAEKAHRFQIFKKNLKHIEAHNINAGVQSYTLGLNEFADLTNEEFVATHTGLLVPGNMEFEEYEVSELVNVSSPLPPSKNWKDDGAVTRVKHQGNCDCCWAFTAAATVEGLVQIETGVLHDLSEQQIVDCASQATHCKPGHIYLAYDYIISNKGLTTSANYPYTGIYLNTCEAQKEKQTVATIKGYKRLARNNEAALKAAVAQQPIAVAIEASTDIQLYTGGIFRGVCTTGVNHAVTLIGYGVDAGTKYWIVKNSWGPKWGEQGYIRLERDIGAKEGLCGIAMWPLRPVM